MNRRETVSALTRALGRRDLVWFGTRGDDVQGVLDVPNLARSFSVINTFLGSASVAASSLEDHSGLRVDLDAHDIDDDPHAVAVDALRSDILRALRVPSAVFTYRPSMLVSAACFTRPDAVHLGLFKDHQCAFEHKPWVESEIAALDLPVVPWKHVSDDDLVAARRMLDDGPILLRVSRSSGGAGIELVGPTDDLKAAWPAQDEAFVSVAPYLADAVPVNIGAVVWRDGVSVHHPSVQVIGVPSLTSRPFGYCGNDFAAVKDLERDTVDEIDTSTRTIGEWLRRHGYRGAFGVDFLVVDGRALFLEVNPRFQGSTHLSSTISRGAGESCIMTDHLAAFLGLDAPPSRPLHDTVRRLPDVAHLVHHWLAPASDRVDVGPSIEAVRSAAGFSHADVVLPPGVACMRGATVARYTFDRRVTETGFDLAPDLYAHLVGPTDAPVATRKENL